MPLLEESLCDIPESHALDAAGSPPADDAFLYERIAAHFEQAIAQQTLGVGARMPSVRDIRRQHHVSHSTALQVLRVLESRGLIEARPRVGYFVSDTALQMPAAREPLQLGPFPMQDHRFEGIGERAAEYLNKARLKGPLKVDLGSAMPAPELFDAKLLNQLAVALLREQPQILVHGPSAPFTHPDFQASMARYALGFGVRLAPMDIAATFGNSEAVNLALDALTQPGDMVAIESPTFYGILQAIEAKKLQALEIPSSPHTGMSIEALELALRTHPNLKAVVVVPHLQMPQGATMPDSH
ncbi:aminotransferase class I/II-fold pyridoxal phosphate-dependent enzyme, partial [Comamonas sp. B-9]|uniref:aminotransferase class I/II-fold pyridoxal phosphate-dependent enzyme n=1 Tax=Comamonas sp. B-9 TaxID=1055192 RepID=UPI0035A0B230